MIAQLSSASDPRSIGLCSARTFWRLRGPIASGGLAALVLAASAVLAGCGSSTRSQTPRQGSRASFYQPPRPLPDRPPGTLIRAEKVQQPPLNPPATIWRILYHSSNVSGRDVAVSGFAIIPTAPLPTPLRTVYAWAHGSAGQADRCAPSRDIARNLPPYGGQLVGHGVVLVATDYEGLGTPGEATTYAGTAEGHAVLDSVRAVAQLPGVGKLGPVVIAGQSQGGGAALWAAQLAHSYAPRLDVRGVVALAPAAEFPMIVNALHTAPFSGFLGEALWAIDGLRAAYGARVPTASLLTAPARADLTQVANECAEQTIARWRGRPASRVFAHDPLSNAPFVRLLNEISPRASDPTVPILLAQGGRDEEIPASVSARLEMRYCREGAAVSRRVYAGSDHDGVIEAAEHDALAWMSDRIAGRTAPSRC